jgi:predicted nuclease of predicted toxin-antitoxin system
MKFFFDNNLSHRLAKAMNLLEEDEFVMHLKDKFRQDEIDEVWLKYVGSNGLVLVTRDQKIRKRRAELIAFRKHSIGAFILTGKNLGRWQEIKQLIWAWENMKKLAASTQRPFAFQVPPKGNIKSLSL